jgi:hypothetical protein
VQAYRTWSKGVAACSLADAAKVTAVLGGQPFDFVTALLSDDAIGASAAISCAEVELPIGVLLPVTVVRWVP